MRQNPRLELTLRSDGRWQKKIKGKTHYFTGSYAEAIRQYTKLRDQLDGIRPVSMPGGHTLRQIANAFLADRERRVQRGTLALGTWSDYKETATTLLTAIGPNVFADDLTPADFTRFVQAVEITCGTHQRNRHVRNAKTLFRWAQEAGYIQSVLRYGPDMKPEKAPVEQGQDRVFTREQIHAILDAAKGPVRAMTLLALNSGIGNWDIAHLPLSAIDWRGRMIRYDRLKTGAKRSIPLWHKTRQALRQALRDRPEPMDEAHADLLFLTHTGRPWVRERAKREGGRLVGSIRVDAINQEFAKVMEAAGVRKVSRPMHTPTKGPYKGQTVPDMRRSGRVLTGKGLGFYTCRHTFRTIADEQGDQHAILRLMGHQIPGISRHYVRRIADERLVAVVQYVHDWIFAK